MAGGIEHAHGLYMMPSMPMDVDHRAITVEEVMRANFPQGWPNSDAVILQLDGNWEGASIDWTQLLDGTGCIQRIHQLGGQSDLIHRFSALKTSSGRPVGQADDGSDSMETGSLASQPSLSGDLRPADQIDRQWPDPVDPPQAETFDSTEVTTGPSCGPLLETMRQALLQLVLGNEANDCYVNSVVQAELWRCCVDSNFGWQTMHCWNLPLQRVLGHGTKVQWLTDPHVLGTCLAPWFAVHARDEQQDAAEFAGWLRQSLHQGSCQDLGRAPRWEARLEQSIEDWGLTFAPIVLRQEKSVCSSLQELIELWSNQLPFRYGVNSWTTNVCLRVNRFPTMGVRSKSQIQWNRHKIFSSGVHVRHWVHHPLARVHDRGHRPSQR